MNHHHQAPPYPGSAAEQFYQRQSAGSDNTMIATAQRSANFQMQQQQSQSNFNNNNNNGNSGYANCRPMPMNSDTIPYNTNNNKAAYGYHPTSSRTSQFQNQQNSTANTQQRNFYPSSLSGDSFSSGSSSNFTPVSSGSIGNRILPSTSSNNSYQSGPSNFDFPSGPSGSKDFQSGPSSGNYQSVTDRIGFHSRPCGQPVPITDNRFGPSGSSSGLPSIASSRTYSPASDTGSFPPGPNNNNSFLPGPSSSNFNPGHSSSNTIPSGSNNTASSTAMTMNKMYVNRQTRRLDTDMKRTILQQYILKNGYPVDTKYSALKRTPSHLFTRHYLGTRPALHKSEFDQYLPKPACKAIHPHADLFLNLKIEKNGPTEELGELVFDQETLAGIAKVQSMLLVDCPAFLKPVEPEPVSVPAPTPIPTPPVTSPTKRKLSQFQVKVEEIPLDQCHGLNARQHLLLVQQQNQRPAHLLNREPDGPLFLQQPRQFQVPHAPAVRAIDETGNNMAPYHSSVQRPQSFGPPKPDIMDAYVYDGTTPGQFRPAKGFAETAPTTSTMQYTPSMASAQSNQQSVFWPSPSSSSSSSSAASAQALASPPLVSPVRGQTRSSRPIPPNMVVFDQNRPSTLRGLPNRPNPSAPSNPGNPNARSNGGGNAGRNLSPAKAAPAPASLRRKDRTIVSTAKAIVSYFPIDENPNPIKRRRTGSPFSELNPSTIGMVP